mmetsp:Transcript_1438/g.4211  ORF Transcript_1438/g.4211 Transcript_1438/m.4211 type:complete len:238 (+) Transcript_1438:966-1679(+)
MNTSADRYSAGSRSFFTAPRKVTRLGWSSSLNSSLARRSSDSRAGPSPAITSHVRSYSAPFSFFSAASASSATCVSFSGARRCTITHTRVGPSVGAPMRRHSASRSDAHASSHSQPSSTFSFVFFFGVDGSSSLCSSSSSAGRRWWCCLLSTSSSGSSASWSTRTRVVVLLPEVDAEQAASSSSSSWRGPSSTRLERRLKRWTSTPEPMVATWEYLAAWGRWRWTKVRVMEALTSPQ